MYGWIWRHLPGNWFTKVLGCLVLFAAVATLLFLFVFPWAEHWLPFQDVTIDEGTGSAAVPDFRP